MSLLESIAMGLVQGLTEFLPVSSSGHLSIFKNIFHINLEGGMLFDVLLHLGTLLAVFVAFHKDIWKMILEGFGIIADFFRNIAIFFKNMGTDEKQEYIKVVRSNYRKFVMLVIVSTIPTGIIGVVGKDLISNAGKTLLIPGICLMITSVLLFIADRTEDGHKKPKDITYTNSFAIGICQGISTLPGLSRSGTTITACLLSGFDRKFAVKYSFIMSIPAILGANILELKDIGKMSIESSEIGIYIAGVVVAAIVGYICIKTMLVVVKNKKFIIFAIYCLIAGILSVAGSFLLV